MIINSITIEITGEEKVQLEKKWNIAAVGIREDFMLDDGMHLVYITQKVKGNDAFDSYIYRFVRPVEDKCLRG